jgi:hypothetical protein
LPLLWFCFEAFIKLRYAPYIFSLDSAFIMKGYWNFQRLFSSIIEMIMWLLSLILSCAVSHLPICICWTILAFLEWIQVDHGIWFFQWVEFSLQVFYWEFLHLYSSRILAYSFLFLLYICGFSIKVILVS